MSEETTRRGRGTTATAEVGASEVPTAEVPQVPPQPATPPVAETPEEATPEVTAEEVKEPTPEEISAALKDLEEEIMNTLPEVIRATREVTEGVDPEGKSFGAALLEGGKTFWQAVKDSILQPLQSRGTTREVNERAFRNSDDYKTAVEYAKELDMPIVEEEDYPLGKLPEKLEAVARRQFKPPVEETEENKDQTVPLSPPSFSFHYSAGTPTAGAATPRHRATSGNGGEEATGRKYRNLIDTIDNSETNIWNQLWKAFAEANKVACEKAAAQKPQVFPAGKGGNRIPSLGYNNKGMPSGRMLLDWMIDLRMPEVKGMTKGNFLPSLMPWGRQQRIRDAAGNLKPRFILVNQDGSKEPFI